MKWWQNILAVFYVLFVFGGVLAIGAIGITMIINNV